jgi:hypothetical protein
VAERASLECGETRGSRVCQARERPQVKPLRVSPPHPPRHLLNWRATVFKIFQYKYSQSENFQAFFSPLIHFSQVSTKFTPPLAPRGRLFATIPTGISTFLSWSTRQCASFYARNPAPLQHTRNQWPNSLQPNCLIQPTHITRLH